MSWTIISPYVSIACTRTYGAVEVKFHTCCTSAVEDCGQLHNGAALTLGKNSPGSPTEMEVLYSTWWWWWQQQQQWGVYTDRADSLWFRNTGPL